MIEAAERLFAERGIHAVSLREIAVAAGQRNHSAVTYTFGSRAGLVQAVAASRLRRIDQRRRAMLIAYGSEPSARDLLEALVVPLADSVGHDGGTSWYCRFLRQVAFDPAVDLRSARAAEGGDELAGLRAVLAGLSARLGHLPGALRGRRILQVWQMAIHALADHETQMAAGAAGLAPVDLLVADLIDCAAAVLAAPVSEETARRLARHSAPPATRSGAGAVRAAGR
jgi:AcrR family transcriptional regulator